MVSDSQASSIIETLRNSPSRGRALRREAMELLDTLPDYDWSGIYALEDGELLLDEYVGEATEHTRIPVGRGVCGTAVAENRNQVIEDVRELENYLSCSIHTRAEIVVLIRDGDMVLGQIDIDGHRAGAFDKSDEDLLEGIAGVLAARW